MSRLPTIPKKYFDVKSKFVKGGKITLTPFNVGMESLLLQVKDGSSDDKRSAINQLIQECLITQGVDVDSLPVFLIEEIFIRLRQHSIGELIEKQYQCTNETENGPCNAPMLLKIDLNDFKLIENEDHSKVIMVSDPIGIKFKYPNLSMSEDGTDETSVIISCIESIFNGDDVFQAEDSSKEELLEFWNQFTLLQKKEVFDKFFHSMPKIDYKKTLKCPKCGYNHQLNFGSIDEVFQD